MYNLPEDIQKEILSFVMVCGKNSNYIVNKETYNYFKSKNFHKCGPVVVLGKHVCKNCYKKEIQYFQMICMNCSYF